MAALHFRSNLMLLEVESGQSRLSRKPRGNKEAMCLRCCGDPAVSQQEQSEVGLTNERDEVQIKK